MFFGREPDEAQGSVWLGGFPSHTAFQTDPITATRFVLFSPLIPLFFFICGGRHVESMCFHMKLTTQSHCFALCFQLKVMYI